MTNTNGSNSLREDIPESEKAKDSYKQARLDYAENILKNYNNERQRMTRLYNNYNGITNPLSMEWLTKTYGQENKAPYISYRVTKVKIDLLQGEWLKRPLISTVTTINSDSVSSKMQQYDFMKGAMIARDEITAVKNIAGVDVMEGLEIPENESVFAKMNFKDKCEDVMQIITDKAVVQLDVKKKLSECFRDCEITNYAYAMIELNQKGQVELHWIDPRNAIYEAIDGDDYLEKSPIRGCKREMSVQDILLRYELTKEQRDKLDQARQNPDAWVGPNGYGRGYMRYDQSRGGLVCDVIHIEWDSVTPLYYKIVPKTKSQLEIDPDGNTLTFEMDTFKYEANKAYHDKNVSEGKYEIVTKFIQETYEATRIGGVIDVNMRKVQGKKRSIDNPSEILSATYVGYIHGRVNGVTVSLQQLIENFSNIYDLIQYKKNIEIAKMKGKYITIDKAGLGQKQKLTDVYYRLVNDQVVEFDSSAAGNLGGRQLDPKMMFQTGDLGLSDSFKELLIAEQNIINNINQISGINENRQGVTAASSTATAQQSDIANSRTITEALFYGFSGFTKRVMKAIVDKSAISYAFYRKEEGEAILGSEKYAFLQSSIDLAYRDYGLEIEDGSRYMEISQKIERMMEFSLNAKEIRPMDALHVLLAPTVAEQKNILEQSWIAMQAQIEKAQAADRENAAAMNEQNLQTQLQIARENREDLQKHDVDKEILKGQVQIEVNRAKAQDDSVLQQQKIAGDIITKTEPPQP